MRAFVPEALAAGFVYPEQFFSQSRPDVAERRLLLAVFDLAIVDATRFPVCGETYAAREWLRSDDDDPFSARWVADYLGLDLTAVRASIADRGPIATGHRIASQPRKVNGRTPTKKGRAANAWTTGAVL